MLSVVKLIYIMNKGVESMKINYFNQPKDIKLAEVLIQKLAEDFDKFWLVSGFTKDTGVDILLDAIASSKISEKNVFLGLDKKNTSKDMLIRLLNSHVNLKTIVNNENEKIETRVYLFSKKDGDSYVYLSASKLSKGGISENNCLVTEIIYGKDEYSEVKDLILKIEEEFLLRETDVEKVKKLAEDGEIAARIAERKIPRIADMYSNEGVQIGENQYDESVGLGLDKEELNDVDIDVDLPIK